jgi:hypothetical protein
VLPRNSGHPAARAGFRRFASAVCVLGSWTSAP